MRFSFEHLGVVRRADIEIGNLTVLCGANNTGKTYITYAVWAIINRITKQPVERDFIENLKNQLDENGYTFTEKDILKTIESEYLRNQINSIVKDFAFIFNTDKDKFKDIVLNIIDKDVNTSIEKNNPIEAYLKNDSNLKEKKSMLDFLLLEFNKTAFGKNFLYRFAKLPFLLTAQRDSIELFYKSIDKNNSSVIRELQTNTDMSLLDNLAKFSLPLQKNIDFARELPINRTSYLSEEHPEIVKEIETLLGVEYVYDGTSSNHYIKTAGQTELIPIHTASTSVRALMHLHYWLKHSAQKGDLLMIDEPELNLHPRNQIKMARLFAKLVNVGIKVWITTHSDYIVKELNNLVMLGSVENPAEMCQKLDYKTNEILKAEDLRAYIAEMKDEGAEVRAVTIDPQYGMEESAFDFEIVNTDKIANKLAQHIKPIPTNEA